MNTVFPFSGASTSSIPSSLGDSTLDLQGGQKNVIPPDKKNKRNPTIKYRKEVKKPLTKAMERILLGFQVLIIILFAIFVNYDSEQADAVTISQMRVLTQTKNGDVNHVQVILFFGHVSSKEGFFATIFTVVRHSSRWEKFSKFWETQIPQVRGNARFYRATFSQTYGVQNLLNFSHLLKYRTKHCF